ncbi:hypothetical protein H4R18_000890 [Coemansia javaensis]|uniref:Uncharacterized protein n=1 Tax=Coemansia javaensis TaxID=2761396 RepID=A0A9W8LM65_9FUNG|nr:hypothetical protein H4R18_000890 [Coemansia javaensis]
MPDLAGLLGQLDSKWRFAVTAEWSRAVEALAGVSLGCSVLVLAAVGFVAARHPKHLGRLSLRVSGYMAGATAAIAAAQIAMQHNALMLAASRGALRAVAWCSMFGTLAFVFLTCSIALQLHLTTLTRVRPQVYMRLERLYVPGSLALAAALPSVAVGLMRDISWDPLLRAFSWPTAGWRLRLTLWMCEYAWVVLVIVYCAAVAVLLSLRILQMWRNSVEVVPAAPERWDWARLTRPGRAPDRGSSAAGGYMVTLVGSDAATGRAVAVRSYVDKRRFLMSIQRLACYPLVPVLTLLGTVAMNMSRQPVRGLYVYGTVTAAMTGTLNLAVFLLNPALPDIVCDALGH